MADLIGDMYRDTLRIPCPFLISMAIHSIDREKATQKAMLKTLRSDQRAKSSLHGFYQVRQKSRKIGNGLKHV